MIPENQIQSGFSLLEQRLGLSANGLPQGRYDKPHAMDKEEYAELCPMLKGRCLEKLVI